MASSAVSNYLEAAMPEVLAFPSPRCPSPEMTVGQVVLAYLAYAVRFLAPRSYTERARIVQRFAATHGVKPVSACRRSDLEIWLADQVSWQSDSTRRSALSAIQRCFNWAVADEVIPRNPFRGVCQQDGEPRRPMTDGEFRSLLRHAAPIFRRVLVFLALTGCRPGEMCKLLWAHIDWQGKVIVLRKHKTIRMQREPKPRVIPLVPAAVKLLLWIRRQQEAAGLATERVFTNSRGNPWNRCNLSLRMQRLRRLAGVAEDCVLYCCRHRVATDALVKGIEIKTVAELLGHTSVRTLERHYAHLERHQEHLRAALQQAVSREP